MTYKKILIPHNEKQKRITIPKELGLNPDDEIILLKKEDYEILNAKDNTELLDKIKELENNIKTLDNENQDLKETIEANNKDLETQKETINNLLENNNQLSQDLQANKFNKQKLDETIKELELLRELTNKTINNLIKSNIDTAKDLIIKLDNEYKNINFIDRLFNRMSNKIDLTKYTDEITQTYNKELENTQTNLLLTSGKLENFNNTGLIDPDENPQK